MSDAAILARGLSKRFGDFTAVDDVTIEVARGSVFAFLGANGSGKTTTIRMLIGLLVPTTGEIEVDGVDVIRHPRRVRDRIGYMGQKVSLYPRLTLRENVEFYAGLYGLSARELDERWGAAREQFALAEAEREAPENLPAGVRQRAGLALATLHRPRILFLDEPTAGVDVQSRSLFWALIQAQARAGVTVFVTTHFLEEADYCDTISFIDAGRLIARATPEELRRRHSPGYRVEVELAPSLAERAAETLRREGFDASVAGERLSIRAGVLDAAAFARLRAVLGEEAFERVRIEQPAMNGIFRSLIEGARNGASGETAPATEPNSA